MELNGTWRVTPADDDVRRRAIGVDVDDDDWAEIEVPGHWRHHPDFANNDDPLLYRRRFTMPPPDELRRRWITLDGIFYQADVFLDGAYLGDPEGYFLRHSFDVTALSRIGDEHVLAIEVACSPQRHHRGKRNITGIFQHWDGNRPQLEPRRHLASRARPRHRSRPDRPVPRPVPRRRRDPRPPAGRRAARQRRRPAGGAANPRRRCRRRRERAPARERHQRGRMGGSTSPTRPCGGRARSAANPSPTSASRC